ncbi:hypothetical protein ACQJBY_026581 [Aegilops geniculata]
MAKARRFVVLALRIATAAAAGVAAIVMATSHKTTTVFGVQVQAKFQYTPSFVFFVAANVVACAYSLLAVLLPPASPAARHVLVADAVLGMVLTGAAAAAAAISALGKNGNSHAGWQPICGLVPTFCDHVTGALACGLVAVVLHLLIVLHSIYTMNS